MQEETKIKKVILSHLKSIPKLHAIRIGSGAFRAKSGSYFRSGEKGDPDIIVCYKGKFIGFEIKTMEGKQREKQKLIERMIVNAGGKYFIIRSIDDVINSLKKIK